MKTTDKENKNNIDDFFEEYFNSLPGYNESEQRDKILLNTILANAEKKRSEIHGTNQKISIIGRIKDLFMSFTFKSATFGIAASLAVISLVYFVFFTNIENNPQLAKMKQPKIINNNNNIKPDNNDVAINNFKTNDNKTTESISTQDFGNISFDYTDRGTKTTDSDTKTLVNLAISIVADVLKESKIDFKTNGNSIETEWINDNDQILKLICNAEPKTKELKLTLKSKINAQGKDYKKVNTNTLKKKISDNLYKYINLAK